MHTSPIQNRIGQVFIPVRDIQRAARWYSDLLGLPVGRTSHADTIYDIPTSGETRLALDANVRDFDTAGPPRFFFWTASIEATVRFLRECGAEDISEAVDVGSVTFVQFRDPDGNLLMVCQPNR